MSKIGLQSLLNICHVYSKKWRFQYNNDKCAVIIIGNDTCPGMQLKLGDRNIKISNCEPHLGIIITNNKKYKSEYVRQRVDLCLQMCYSLMTIGNHNVPLNPIVASKVCMDYNFYK